MNRLSSIVVYFGALLVAFACGTTQNGYRVRFTGENAPLSATYMEMSRTGIDKDMNNVPFGEHVENNYKKGQPITLFDKKKYALMDTMFNQEVPAFDPEEWFEQGSNQQLPPYLDVPFGWSVYNPVTVQAPRPDINKLISRSRFSGIYYACPDNVNPYEFAWYLKKEAVNPCRWTAFHKSDDSSSVAPQRNIE